jgi:hypothetical protein
MRLKSELYKDEQYDIMNNIITILQLDSDNGIILHELDNNTDKQNEIMKLLPLIRKYFTFRNIVGAKDPDKVKRPYLSIIRHITKLQYKILSCDYILKINDNKIRTKKFIFIKTI